MPNHTFQRQSGSSKESLLDRAIDRVKPQPGPPPRPHAPAVDEGEWHKSVERKQVVPGLTVHDVGLSVYGETRSLHDRPGSNEPLDSARQMAAHAIINGQELARQTGKKPPMVHPPVEPPKGVLHNPKERAAYDSSMNAAREAYLSGHDPTQGATHFNMRPSPHRSPFEGTYPLSTQSGPYDNSFPSKNAPRHTTWLNTYLPDEIEKKQHKRK